MKKTQNITKSIKFSTQKFYHWVYQILILHGGANNEEETSFVNAHTRKENPTKEWRFQGNLGFGGKYYCDNNTVSFYREDETPTRLETREKINSLLKSGQVDPQNQSPRLD